jgi:hypothetical protein
MLLYDVLYYQATTGKLVGSCDSGIPWDAISAPSKGQVALAICVNGQRTETWMDVNKTEIPRPTFARA